MSKSAKGTKRRRLRAWADMTADGSWGVETDHPDYRADSHYICVIPKCGNNERERILAQTIADALSGTRTPLVEVILVRKRGHAS